MEHITRRQYLLCARKAICLCCPEGVVCDTTRRNRIKVECDKQTSCPKLELFSDNYRKVLDEVDDNTDTGQTKVCKCCGEEKPLSEFHKGSGKYHRRNECKQCFSRISATYMKRQINEVGKQKCRKKLLTDAYKELEYKALLNSTNVVFEDKKERKSYRDKLRYEIDSEYQTKAKEGARKRYYDPESLYLVKKYLKRHLKSLEEWEMRKQLIEIRPKEQLPYNIRIRLEKAIRKCEIYKEKIRAEREIIEKNMENKP